MRDRVRGAMAAVVLLAMTVGLPVAMAATVGNPLRHLGSIRADRLSDADVTAVLAAVCYLAWASFLVAVLIEFAVAFNSRFTHRAPRQVRLPLLGTQHDLARRLVSAVLLLMPAASVSFGGVAVAAPAHVAAIRAHVQPIVGDSSHPAPRHADHGEAVRRYVIPEAGGMRNYWTLAEHYLGDGSRWREIWHLNEGRVHADGTVMDTPRRLYAGWTVLIPPAAIDPGRELSPTSHDVHVRPGDTLSGIGATNGIADWRPVWRINRDRVEPGGAHFSDPNLIRPGWTITLPARPDATSTASQTPPTDSGHLTPRGQADDPKPDAPSDAGLASASHRKEPRAEQRQPHTEAGVPSHHQVPSSLVVGLSAVAGLAAVDRARRMAQRRRRIGHRLPTPPPELREVEAQLRRDARSVHPVAAAIQLALALSAAGAVEIRAVTARNDGAVDLHLDGAVPNPPAPFTAVPGGWRLPADAQRFTYAVDEEAGATSVLVPIGRTGDGELLVDLASGRPVGIAGDTAAIRAYLGGIVATLSGTPWAERVQVHVPDALADRVAGLDRVTVDGGAPLLPASQPMTQAPADPVGEDPGCRTSTPIYLYCGWAAGDDIEELMSRASDPAAPVHAIVVGARPDTDVWTIEGDRLMVPGVADAVQISVPHGDAPSAADLVAFTAEAPDVPAGDSCLPDLAAEAPPAHTHGTSADPLAVTESGPRQLNLLGPVDLTGVRWLRRGQILELLAYLALHRRGADRHQLLGALWPDQAPSLKTLRNRITEARGLVDGAISDGPLWRLDESVTTDWQRFTALASGDHEQQREALALITGRPFTGLDHCDWLDLEGIRSEVEATIVDVALSVGEADLAAGRLPEALAAARSGLLASRYEERLHRLAIRAAEAQDLTGVAKTLRQEMHVTLGEDVELDGGFEPEAFAM